MVRIHTRALLLLSLAMFVLAGRSESAIGTISVTEFPLQPLTSGPLDVAAGPDGALWLTEFLPTGTDNGIDSRYQIRRVTTHGDLTNTFLVPGITDTAPYGIVAGPDGNLWLIEQVAPTNPPTSAVLRVTPAGVATEFNTGSAGPGDITVGPDGALWFTEFAANKIGRITTTGAITEFAVPTAGASLAGITAGPDGNLWFAEAKANKIGRLTPQGVFKEFSLPRDTRTGAPANPTKIVTGPDNNLWFIEFAANRIGRITPHGAVTEFSLPRAGSSGIEPGGITAGPDGNLWFTEGRQAVGRITTTGVITEFIALKAGGGNQAGIATGADGNIWFTEPFFGSVARVNLANPSICTPGPTTLCIDDQPGDNRWQVTVAYHTAQGGGLGGDGHALSLANLGVAQGGLFWFFGAGTPEMLIKVLNACTLSQHFWVFASATTNAAFTITVTDTRTGRVKTYSNADGHVSDPVQDTSAFSCLSRDDLATESAADANTHGDLERELASGAAPASSAVPRVSPGCTTDATTLCINGRFSVQTSFQTAQAGSGLAQVIGLGSLGISQGGLFWYFSHDNPELLVKVLDGCALNKKYWVFFAAGTNVGFTVKVTDTQTGHMRSYTNADGAAALPVQDTSALDCN